MDTPQKESYFSNNKQKGLKQDQKQFQAKHHLKLVHMLLILSHKLLADYRETELRDLMKKFHHKVDLDLLHDHNFQRLKARLVAEDQM